VSAACYVFNGDPQLGYLLATSSFSFFLVAYIARFVGRGNTVVVRIESTRDGTRYYLLKLSDFRDGYRLLKLFSFLLPCNQREDISLSLGDLKKDRKEMEREKFDPWIIRGVLLWRAVRIIIPIAWAGFKSVLKEVTPFAKTISRYIGRD
jgi:hypothetical protein